MWMITIALSFGAMGLWLDGRFIGARTIALALGVWAMLACPFLWAQPEGLVPAPLTVAGRTRLILALALFCASPLLLPWQVWL